MEEENKEFQNGSKKDINNEIINQVENLMYQIQEQGVNTDNVDFLGKIVDIHKDLKNEEYWKEKEEMYMYRDYNDYSDGSYGRKEVRGTGPYSRYRDSGNSSYGRRGVPGTGRGRYRGEDMMDEMYRAYNDYMDSADYGNYGTSESMQKIEIMADSLMDFIHHIKKEAKTPEERQLIEEKLQEIGRM